MALRLEDKKALVAEVKQAAETAHSALAAEYRGLTVTEMTELRRAGPGTGRLPARRQEHLGQAGDRRY